MVVHQIKRCSIVHPERSRRVNLLKANLQQPGKRGLTGSFILSILLYCLISCGCAAKHKYEIFLYWSNEDEVFVAEVSELHGCMAHGHLCGIRFLHPTFFPLVNNRLNVYIISAIENRLFRRIFERVRLKSERLYSLGMIN